MPSAFRITLAFAALAPFCTSCSGETGAGGDRIPAQPASGDAGVWSGKGDFSAIGDSGWASTSVVRFLSSKPTDKALVLAAGHSVGILDSGTQPPAGSASVMQPTNFSFFLADPAALVPFRAGVTAPRAASDVKATLPVVELLYATLTGSDLALYRLDVSYADLERAYGVKPLVLTNHPASSGTHVRIASGLYHAVFSCSIEALVHELREGAWTWHDSIRYSQPGCEVVGGTSGSPVVDAATLEVLAVNNTINEAGQECTGNNPCEVDASGHVTATLGAAYGQQVYWIYDCLSENNDIELDRPGCQLTRPQLK